MYPARISQIAAWILTFPRPSGLPLKLSPPTSLTPRPRPQRTRNPPRHPPRPPSRTSLPSRLEMLWNTKQGKGERQSAGRDSIVLRMWGIKGRYLRETKRHDKNKKWEKTKKTKTQRMGHVYFSIFSLIISVFPEMISFLAFRTSLFSFLAIPTYLPSYTLPKS